MYYYGFTLRRLTNGTPEEKVDSLLSVLSEYKRYYGRAHIEYHFEVVTKSNGNHNIHVHGVMKTPRKPFLKKMHPGQGYHFYVEELSNEMAWEKYMTKLQIGQTREEVLWFVRNMPAKPVERSDPQEVREDEDGIPDKYKKINLFSGSILTKAIAKRDEQREAKGA